MLSTVREYLIYSGLNKKGRQLGDKWLLKLVYFYNAKSWPLFNSLGLSLMVATPPIITFSNKGIQRQKAGGKEGQRYFPPEPFSH